MKAPDAVLEMDDEVVLVQLAEIDLRALRAELARALQPAPAMGRRAPKNFRGGEHDEIRRRENKSRGPSVPSTQLESA